MKYFILTEIQEQCLNPMPERLIGPGRLAEQTDLSVVSDLSVVVSDLRSLSIPGDETYHVQTAVHSVVTRGAPSISSAIVEHRTSRWATHETTMDKEEKVTQDGRPPHPPRIPS